jgi:hypothetical protein
MNLIEGLIERWERVHGWLFNKWENRGRKK